MRRSARMRASSRRPNVVPESICTVCNLFTDRLSQSAKATRISRRTSAQDSNVFQRQAEARLQLGVIDIEQPHADALLAGVVPGPNESANETRAPRREAQ